MFQQLPWPKHRQAEWELRLFCPVDPLSGTVLHPPAESLRWSSPQALRQLRLAPSQVQHSPHFHLHPDATVPPVESHSRLARPGPSNSGELDCGHRHSARHSLAHSCCSSQNQHCGGLRSQNPRSEEASSAECPLRIPYQVLVRRRKWKMASGWPVAIAGSTALPPQPKRELTQARSHVAPLC